MKKYLWSVDDDDMHGLFSACESAMHDAITFLRDVGEYKVEVTIWDARPATEDDAELFDGGEHYDGEPIDVNKLGWWREKWVPENIVHKFTFRPEAYC